ncbi:MAG TPA: class I SAM-dependent methyltransferase [Candidatus Acidoferrum sp.]|nr:class I SAM-dependent methyltransferase [Candidatus Acidoferrum sp.]
MRLHWRIKAFGYRVFDALPQGHELYLLSQKYVTKTLPRRGAAASEQTAIVRQHRAALDALPPNPVYFEFGAGWDLYANLVQWCYGLDRQCVYDLRRWARASHVNAALRHLHAEPPPNAARVPTQSVDDAHLDDDLRRFYGIDYRAPADAGATGLRSGSVDCIATTSVLEHIPENQLRRLLRECKRLMHRDSLMSHVIDYSDHYAHGNAVMSPYNFLRYSQQAWRRYNPDVHFQNRWRHADYRCLFEELGFRVVHESLYIPEDARAQLQCVPLAQPFAGRRFEELAPLGAHLILALA